MKHVTYPDNVVLIAVGSNLEDRMQNCEQGIAALESPGGLEVMMRSGFYLTEPVGYTEQPWYINAAVMARTDLSPSVLLGFLKTVEQEAGRVACGFRNGPRKLDLDIIFYNDWIIESSELVVPHPRMHERGFVLKPLDEIAADWVHPVFQKKVSRLLAEMGDRHEACLPMTATYN